MATEVDSTETILVVDDNEQNRLVAEAHLVPAGYAVVMAAHGQQALDIFDEGGIDLVLLDILMPGWDGFETCRRLRSTPHGVETPVLFLTALGNLEIQEKALASGGDDFLSKPIQRVELLLRVRSLLRLKRLQSDLKRSHALTRSQRDALLRSQEQKRRLTAMIVHDLKNPLGVMLSTAQYVLDECLTPRRRDEAAEALQDLVESSALMQHMVMDLLDVDMAEDGALIPKLTQVDALELLQSSVRSLQGTLRLTGHRIELSVPPEARQLSADSDLLRRVLQNVLENSLKYAPSGSVIDVRCQTDGNRWHLIQVSDHGPGVREDQRERIFEPYLRLEDEDGHARTSRGLGLTFCRLAVEAHGGRIWVEDNVPEGSRFCVQLPRQILTGDEPRTQGQG